MHVRHPHPRSAFRWLLPRRTVRYRLAVVYGGLFVVCGAVLLAVTGLLWGRATGGRYVVAAPAPVRILAIAVPPRSFGSASGITQVNVHQARPIGPNLQQIRRVTAQLRIVAAGQRSSDLHQLLLYSGIGLAIMVMLASALGWLAAGRVLRPLRTITSAVRDISATNLHKRLDLGGPDDELKLLGDTFDQLLERLDRSFQSQRLFVANASHELRTPLATMRASLDVALAKPGPVPDQMATLAKRLHDELDEVDRLLESFLALARAQRGHASAHAPLALDLLVGTALAQRAAPIADLAITVEDHGCAEAMVSGNATLLARMVENLVDNAVRHNVPGGFVRIVTGVDAHGATLVVENGGEDLTAVGVGELIQPFRRLGADRTGSGEGFGLGLSIVDAVAEAHGGRLELRPLAGGGLRATVLLPLARDTLVRTHA